VPDFAFLVDDVQIIHSVICFLDLFIFSKRDGKVRKRTARCHRCAHLWYRSKYEGIEKRADLCVKRFLTQSGLNENLHGWTLLRKNIQHIIWWTFLILDFHSVMNTDSRFWGFYAACKITLPTTFREPLWVPKRRLQIYHTHRVKTPKTENLMNIRSIVLDLLCSYSRTNFTGK
jgi:hypothetical protein